MYSKGSVFVLVAILSLQGSSNALSIPLASTDLVTGIFDEVIKFVQDLLLGVNQLLGSLIVETRITIKEIVSGVKEIEREVIENAEQQIEHAIDDLNQALEVLKNATTQDGVNIVDCIESVDGEVASAQEKAANESASCIDGTTVIFLNDIDALLIDLENNEIKLKQKENELDNCLNDPDVIGCVKTFFGDLVDIVSELPAQLAADVDMLNTDVNELGKNYAQCVEDTESTLQNDNLRIFNEFAECIKNKESPSN